MTFAPIDRAGPAVEFWVQVQPRAPRAEVAGSRRDALLVRVTAPPRDGEANEAVLRLLAETLHLPRGSIRIIAGTAQRRKRIRIDGLTSKELLERLAPILHRS
ncbi:DUF167 domain-containing protein [Thermomicrobium roseum]|uniref:UPF0235 protein trd_0618 n=1 Tax=Thermomicrobium roseum (strain ATCC 27502 / DSM 5159 / P-2) TaxID=309801 RepID=B9KYR6_THERP|nr:DUF167 domain-containing protein [Thermomicrobium roseum]ACM06264.1 DUF167 [Thermomicrobium roseum DSM 5159]